jgi:RND family efflux transporter MFP subunit
MPDNGAERPSGQTRSLRSPDDASATPVSFHDQALWNKLDSATTAEELGEAWLLLQSRLLPGACRGVVVVGPGESGPFQPVAEWPEGSQPGEAVAAAADLAMSERRGVVSGLDAEIDPGAAPAAWAVAYPISVYDELRGVVAFEIEGRPRNELRSVMRQLQWGAAWIELLLLRGEAKADRVIKERTSLALNLVAAAGEQERFRAACQMVATELAIRLDCDRVSIGFERSGSVRVEALSHSASFGQRMNLIRGLEAAMDEAGDQRVPCVFPPTDADAFQVTQCQESLAREHGSDAVLTVPFGEPYSIGGAVTFERSGSFFDAPTVELCESAVTIIGPVLDEKRRNDRWVGYKLSESLSVQLRRLLGPRYPGRKLAALGLAALATFFYFATGAYSVNGPATLEGEVRRAIVAPFDGYVLSESARAGDQVRSGEPLALLDDSDLRLEYVRWATQRREHVLEYDRALAEGNRANANIARARMEQALAQSELLEKKIARARLLAPFEGVVISGDLSQSVGSSVQRGQILFEVAPLQAYRVIVEVDESDVREIKVGQSGNLLLAALPNEPLSLSVERITPISEAKEGKNAFRVEAKLEESSPRLRPGMKGVGKLDVGKRKLIWIWTHRLFDWLRVRLWAYWP